MLSETIHPGMANKRMKLTHAGSSMGNVTGDHLSELTDGDPAIS
jgi:hypothetical protein